MDDNRWVDERMASLEPEAGWRPNALHALTRFRQRRRAGAVRRRSLLCLLAAAVLTLAVLGEIAPRACARPLGCEQPQTAMTAAAVPAKLESPAKFKLVGNPGATVTLEVYSDYQCPECARLNNEIMPQLTTQYVDTGKIRILHRDFPLQQHTYARTAARYVNAAGQIGRYSVAVDRIFRTQSDWSLTGNIAGALAGVLKEDEMKAVLRAVDSDTHLDDTVAEDMAMAQKDRISHTPQLVIVTRNGRQVMSQNPSFEVLKGYLDSLLAK